MCLAIPGQVVEVLDETNGLVQVDVAGVTSTVSTGLLVDDANVLPGEWVLIHVGFALARIDEREAHATLRLLREATTEYDQALEELRSSAID
ncbi:MAG TPA: HypC/HybG/HupF family hydrogenase formation chaperone [Solirubrobacteraceae bacterium]|nr:HypC/HybG/HupF family hydrogenase formation chaperone [Solirubrobacteraceae bacterium]